MGLAFDCQCLDCDESFQASEGGGFTFIQWVCDGCGKTTSIPRYAPRINRREQKVPIPFRRYTRILTIGSFKIKLPFKWRVDRDRKATPYDKIQRFTQEELQAFMTERRTWWRSGDSWDDFEIDMLRDLIGPCECGGKWVDPYDVEHRPSSSSGSKPHAFHRCPKCRSKKFTYVNSMSFD